MIPTTVTSSAVAAAASAVASNGSGGGGGGGAQQSSAAAIVGIASLILEGRGVADDEHHLLTLQRTHLDGELPLLHTSGWERERTTDYGSGRQSPKPSTSRGLAGHVINITANPHPLGRMAPLSARFIDPYGGGGGTSASSSAESTHKRWTEKLCQLRQACPGAPFEHKVALEAHSNSSGGGNGASSGAGGGSGGEPELVSIAFNDSDADGGGGDFEIVRRVLMNRSNPGVGSPGGGAAVSPGGGGSSEKFLHSLQSLATTCLRGGSPGGSEAGAFHYATPPSNAGGSPKYAYRGATPPRFQSPGTPSSSGSGVQSPQSTDVKEKLYRPAAGRIPIPTANAAKTGAACRRMKMAAATALASPSCPQLGPHCDQFLRKMGLAKGEAADAEDHFCDMSYLNITCSRWRAYCRNMDAIMARGAPVCIEVYLGPVGHKVLLEQWILTLKDKLPPPTMTLPSLCSAIRSQLYFSQLSAWCDLIQNGDQTINETGRVVCPTPTGAAGDLATLDNGAAGSNGTPLGSGGSPGNSPGASPLAQLTSAMLGRQPRLNVFYTVKQYDATATFSAKPNVHNFPSVNVSDAHSVSVCLKSLPRLNGGIPRVVPAPSGGGGSRGGPPPASDTTTPRSSRQPPASGTSTAAAPASGSSSNCDKKKSAPSGGGGKDAVDTSTSSVRNGAPPKCRFFIDEDELCADDTDAGDDDGSSTSGGDTFCRGGDHANGSNLSHREKQLLKYRKRMLRRDKKQRRPLDGVAADRNGHTPMEQGGEEDDDDDEEDEEEDGVVSSSSALLLRRPPTANQIEMISTGTQTSLASCHACGSEKTLVCLTCTGDDTPTPTADMEEEEEELQPSPPSQPQGVVVEEDEDEGSEEDVITSPRSHGELLLQAIQRTPKTAAAAAAAALKMQNNNHLGASTAGGSGGGVGGCPDCKRQKTQHNFTLTGGEEGVTDEDDANGSGAYFTGADSTSASDSDILEMETFVSRTKLTPHIRNCTISSTLLSRSRTPPPPAETVAAAATLSVDCESGGDSRTGVRPAAHKQTPKPCLLQISCHFSDLTATTSAAHPPPPRKLLPKVNLTPIFCGATAGAHGASLATSLSSPIPISGVALDPTFAFDAAAIERGPHAGATNGHDAQNIPVQKSFSAPTLPNSPSLSPRFAKQAAIYKRRSRHLSDRSERSSLGSDEQCSDEDVESPAISPLKSRARIGAGMGRLALLGNLEESLLQRRLKPRVEVGGFKVLLGASGGFCPMQLTIPAMALFYELRGESLSTPYVCDVRLPRKGYAVPRVGVVQATLLNPMGTVVRMFVIPYDMRDMPPLHLTFIRQRVLAEASANETVLLQQHNGHQQHHHNNNNEGENGLSSAATETTKKSRYRLSPSGGLHGESNLGHFISAEHMKRLRYSIHLRFQTSRSGRLSLHTDIRILISRRTDCDTAAAHAKGVLEAPNDLVTDTVMPANPKYSARPDNTNKI